MTDIATGTQDVSYSFDDIEPFRRELTGYCYRMCGSPSEAEDAVQETMVRAWRNLDNFEGRSSLRSWLYRIATNVCFDMLKGRQRRARPMDLEGPQQAATGELGPPLVETAWVQPMPDAKVLPEDADPAEMMIARDSVRLAFVAALQHLPARQRSVLVLREVLRWKASEVATLLDTTVVSVNSTLQRARATLESLDIEAKNTGRLADEEQQALLERYVDAFERYDMEALVALLHEDAIQSMPPFALWLRGVDNVIGWMLGKGIDCKGSRLVPVAANGAMGFGQYRVNQDGSGYHAWALQIVETDGDKVTHICSFLDTPEKFPLFGLPLTLDN